MQVGSVGSDGVPVRSTGLRRCSGYSGWARRAPREFGLGPQGSAGVRVRSAGLRRY